MIGLQKEIFSIDSEEKFRNLCMEIFKFQAENTEVYSEYLNYLETDINHVKSIEDIPFLPIEAFKYRDVFSKLGNPKSNLIFESSGTTGSNTSRHKIAKPEIYEESFVECFRQTYGNPEDWCFFALLPSYLERGSSSLVYMMDKLINISEQKESGFYLNNYQELVDNLLKTQAEGKKILLIGVSFAMLDLAEQFNLNLSDNVVVMETGGMKGRRKEITRSELHSILKKSFNIDAIHSEYGMTELLSQAYSKGDSKFHCPPWMRILIRNPYNPFEYMNDGQRGGINVIDLANIYSCSFLEVQDIGIKYKDNSFEVLGRFDQSQIRGCNLMFEQ
ncbi:MAG: acyl transferase [Marinifilaceae bacterium]|jgi:phenylacetate-coenzyme A ligase PaaK-like adenylate-forming protein|nr:acyl transferase [Marinifilaceae bacterium]